MRDGGPAERHLRWVALTERSAHRHDDGKAQAVRDHQGADRVQRVAEAGALQHDQRHASGGAKAGRVAEALVLARERPQRDAALGEADADGSEALVRHPRGDLDAGVDQAVGKLVLPHRRAFVVGSS